MYGRRSLAMCVSALLLSTVAVSARSIQWSDPYEKGLKAIEASHWTQAATFLEEAIAADPNAAEYKYLEGVFRIDYFPYYHLGVAYLELHQYDRAQENFNKARRGLSRRLIPKLDAFQARLNREKPVVTTR
jgi:tetratricopeptide (TPR) repeat protein